MATGRLGSLDNARTPYKTTEQIALPDSSEKSTRNYACENPTHGEVFTYESMWWNSRATTQQDLNIVRRFSRPSSHRPPNSMYTMLKGCGLFPHLYPLTYLIAVTSAVYIRSTHYSTLPAVLHIPLVDMNQPSELL